MTSVVRRKAKERSAWEDGGREWRDPTTRQEMQGLLEATEGWEGSMEQMLLQSLQKEATLTSP